MKWKFALLFYMGVLVALSGQQTDTVFIHPLVKNYLTDEDTVSCMLVMQDQAKSSSLEINTPKNEKTTQVYLELSSLSTQTQKPLLDSLDTWKITYRSFYIVNAIQVRMDSATLNRIIDQPGLASVLPDFPLISPPELVRPGDIRRQDTLINWAISHIRADSVWRLGITGKDIVVAGLDTGIEWDHDFLRQNYRGYHIDGAVDHNYNWYDAIRNINVLNGDSIINTSNNPCGLSSTVPCDDQGHGTYTMGLMTGVHDNQYTGIAPGTTWIGSRVMERGYGHLSSYLAGLEWCLAPTDTAGQFPRPDMAPDIINNSWACPRKEGCVPENYWMLDSAASRLTQAGIFVISSAGNDGRQGCSSLQSPLAIFPSVFTVGATDMKDSITDFSSRGPIGSSSIIKPEVVAPGKGVTSIYLSDKFQTSSGTSISAPITAGVAALILEANPSLKGRPDLLRNILIKSAVPIRENPCGEMAHPNPVYGYGRIDALKAVQLAREYQPTTSAHQLPDHNYLIYPNPVRDFIYLDNKTEIPSRVIITDIQGKIIKQFTLAGHETKKIMVSNLNSGLHFVRISTKEGFTIRKMLKF